MEDVAFPDLYQQAIDRVKDISGFKLPSEKAAVLKDAFQIAKIQKQFCDLSEFDEFREKELSDEVKFLIL